MSELHALQAWFVRAMTCGADAREGSAQASAELGLPPAEALLTARGERSPLERLAVYHHAYRARLVECLRDDYPALAHLLGEQRFVALCRDYLVAHPSRSFSLNRYGAKLAAHLEARGEPRVHIELAQLEWSIVEAIHAEATQGLTLERIAGLGEDDWARARLLPSAALTLHRFEHPVNRMFTAFKQGLEVSVPEPAASATAVCRNDMTVWRLDLSPAAYRALTALCEGHALLPALSEADANAADVQRWFRAWVECGFFRDVELP